MRDGKLGRLANLLRRHGNEKALAHGKQLHCELARLGCEKESLIGGLLVRTYGSCGRLEESCQAFDRTRQRSVFTWNIMMVAYAQNGHISLARKTFDKSPSHNIVLWNSMLTGYAQNEYVTEAKLFFDEMPERDTVSWNAMISGYVQNGHYRDALQQYRKMCLDGLEPTNATFVSSLDACAKLQSLEDGEKVAFHIDERPGVTGLLARNALLFMYSQCGCSDYAAELFHKMPEWSVASWNIVVAAYAQSGRMERAIERFESMPERSTISWIVMITAYGEGGRVDQARRTFDAVPEKEKEKEIMCWNAMLGTYCQNRRLSEAESFFRDMPQKNAISWSTMITAFNHAQRPRDAWKYYQVMNLDGARPSCSTLAVALNVCSTAMDVKSVHENFLWRYSEVDAGFALALVRNYGRLGRINDAKSVFDKFPTDALLASALVTAFVENGCLQNARELHAKMAVKDVVSGTILLAAHAQDGQLEIAEAIFHEMPAKDVVAWNSMVSAYSQAGYAKLSLDLLPVMDMDGIQPDAATFVVLLHACSLMNSLALGESIYSMVIELQIEVEADVRLGCAIVDMFGKCGSPQDARKVFEGMDQRNVVLWSAMLGVYVFHKQEEQAFGLWRVMGLEGVEPDAVTFLSLLTMCCHAGLLDAAVDEFVSISRDYGLEPGVDHFSCVIDLLGRLGLVNEAEDLMLGMPCKPSAATWNCLLSAYKICGDFERALRVAELNPTQASYLLLSNMYAQYDKSN
ncbi:pentatricopeptide repeat-containing protein At4g02750-like [Selaginella moellendorffii]|uniref:pentatricopeptide repeat-containing protein At4g02750-like n=1 Tax=Selaginella moellendorffii TaxID=88036 RepID=UPI000D1C8798|nr:pentatricopeptide repeat-containing protein At4g02750-like [Selaginella moellendorffii]|eukprot:XP_024545858.1 pentatricopeptide repeat-containing protein At4g02750-like [Selaginella moellendorffii]